MDRFMTLLQSDGADVQNSGGLSPWIWVNLVPSIIHLEIPDIMSRETFVSIHATQISESHFLTSR